MSDSKPLLVEIGCEELPPKALDELSAAFGKGICDGLAKRGIATAASNAKIYNSPRRLAVLVPGVATMQPAQKSEVLGPYLNIGLDANGAPTPALRGFATKNGVAVEQLQRMADAKGERFIARSQKPGQPTAALLQEILVEALKSLPIPKPMRWGDHDYAFVRPVHWLVILHGVEVIDAEIFGIKSGRESRGHRFMHAQAVSIADANAYVDALRAAKVLADPAERCKRVASEVARAAQATGGAARLADALRDEIANLVEWPCGIACAFDCEFLAVPQEALITTMETNQKFVPVFDSAGNLTEHFIGVANIESKDPAEIRKGYERVIRPRFADAKFFFDGDRKTPLAAHQESLKSVTYQQQLGSVWDKCVRVAELSRVIAGRLTDTGCGVDSALATRAASLSKCDLMTRMVGEFPELQGIMGRYYAAASGENADVATALDEFYRPRFAGDAIARGRIGQVLAIAERLDTLAGIFAVGGKPSGSKDPFALRRAALGLARTLIEGGFELDLEALLREAVELLPAIAPAKDAKAGHANPKQGLTDALRDFIHERLRGYYAELGFGSDQFDAVLAVEPESLLDFDRRLRAVAEFAKLPEAAALAAANKRIGNILKQAAEDGARRIDPGLLDAGAECELHQRIENAVGAITPLAKANRYVDMLRALAALHAPVDAFFEQVMVMAEDAAKRRNRVALLAGLRRLFLQVADISLLQGA
ncbi:MAG: glycine--tRNA ligase subunit beta [Xanthomonadaceae bacterium]|nr:glycine--tRNA ligase subunit beta [Xanthomonadaceae bacterium]MDE1961232.1 glycine--tRNA ligase subunit beta [Xanthomonadaceae bacterium]